MVFDDQDTSIETIGESITATTIRGDTREFSLRDGDSKIKATLKGDFKLDDTGNRIVHVTDELEIRVYSDGQSEEARFDKDGRGVSVRYWLDGEEQPAGEDTDAAIDRLTLRFLRASDFGAEQRIRRLVKAGGVDAALDDINQLTADYARASYAKTLAEMETLSTPQIAALAETLAQVEASAGLTNALEAILENQAVDMESAAPIIRAAMHIESDYDRRRLIVSAIDNAPDIDAAHLMPLIETLDSDYDFRSAAEAMIENGRLSNAEVAQLLALAAERIDSDNELRKILRRTAERTADPDVAHAWLEALGKIDGDYDRRKAIEAAAEYADAAPQFRVSLREAAKRIASEHDREKALEALE